MALGIVLIIACFIIVPIVLGLFFVMPLILINPFWNPLGIGTSSGNIILLLIAYGFGLLFQIIRFVKKEPLIYIGDGLDL